VLVGVVGAAVRVRTGLRDGHVRLAVGRDLNAERAVFGRDRVRHRVAVGDGDRLADLHLHVGRVVLEVLDADGLAGALRPGRRVKLGVGIVRAGGRAPRCYARIAAKIKPGGPIAKGLVDRIGKSVFAYTDGSSTTITGYGTDGRHRSFDSASSGDLPASSLTLGVNGDYGMEDGTSRVNPGSNAVWKGIAGYVAVAATNKLSLALRGETLRDEGGVRLGTDTKSILSEGTFTSAYKFTDHVVLRGEVRYDKANQPILARRAALNDRQTTAGINFIIVY